MADLNTLAKLLAATAATGVFYPDEAEAMYVGPKAKGWDKLTNKFSSLMDRMPRAEISDKFSRLRPRNPDLFGGTPVPDVFSIENVSFQDVLSHPQLWKLYPDIAKKKGELYINPVGDSSGTWLDENEMVRGLNWQVYGRTPEEARENLLHEISHAIQKKEGWALGGNPDEFAGQSRSNKMNSYNRLSGEVEARDTAARMNMPIDERQRSLPYASQNIPLKDVITKFGIGGAALGPMLYSPEAAQARQYQNMAASQALQESYSPVDLMVAAATGGSGVIAKMVNGLIDAAMGIGSEVMGR